MTTEKQRDNWTHKDARKECDSFDFIYCEVLEFCCLKKLHFIHISVRNLAAGMSFYYIFIK